MGCSSQTTTIGHDAASTGIGGAAGNGWAAATGGATSGSDAALGSGGATSATGGAMGSAGANAGTGGVTTVTGGTMAATGGTTVTGGKTGVGTGGSTSASGGAAGSTSSDPCSPSNPAVVPLPTIGTGLFDVTKYGAIGDDKTDNTTAIQAALTAAGNAGGGTVTIPSGTFLSGPMVLSSGTRLDISSGAVLKMLPMASYPAGATAFITANKAHDIALTGAGTVEGQGQAWWTAFASDASLARPQEVSLSNSTRVQISGLRFQNPPEEHIWVKGDTDVTITGITISTLAVSGQQPPKNTDGVDIGATGVFFCNNSIACGDDNVVMSGTNIYVAYSTFGVGHGCSIGSITSKGVSNVTVDHITMNGTTSGIRMKSARDRGGLVENLTYSNMTMTNVETPVYITSYYPTLPTDPAADTAQTITATTPIWNNITIKNVTATGSTNAGILWGLPEQPISGLAFDNVRIQATAGMEIFHATGVSFTDASVVTPKSGTAVTVYDATVTGITTTAY